MRWHLPLSLLALAPSCLAWGIVGHEIVATIAQIHLHASAREALLHVLPVGDKGHLAPIAGWADRVRMVAAYRFSGELHYTSPLEDYPPSTCFFGQRGFKTEHDVLHAISNYTSRLVDNPRDLDALRFLVHFVGDAHQPLHLTNRDRGGNSDQVVFEGRKMNLHSLWDTGLITKAVRELHNYTTPLPSPQIENNLRGTIYDPYVRLILWEGVRTWWRSELPAWLDCPAPLAAASLSSSSQQLLLSNSAGRYAPAYDVVCPETWAAETHVVTCGMTFPPTYNATDLPQPDLLTPEYYGPIKEHKTIEKLLAQGGLRLAATLNAIFASPEELNAAGFLRNWVEELEVID